MGSLQQAADLKSIISKYQVCFEVRELREIHHDHLQAVGFEVDLAGTHKAERHLNNPDRTEYHEIYRALHQLARGVIPNRTSPSRVDLLPFDHCVHNSRWRNYRDDVELRLHIIHGQDRSQLLDKNHRACMCEITAQLRNLGAGEGQWIH